MFGHDIGRPVCSRKTNILYVRTGDETTQILSKKEHTGMGGSIII